MAACGNKDCPTCYPKKEQEEPPVQPTFFDEQLRLVSRDGQPASNLPYEISLSDGTKLNGTTDSDGRTVRIGTSRPTDVMSVTITPPFSISGATCCSATSHDMVKERVYVKSETTTIATTNGTEIGISIVPAGQKRKLTMGEIKMAFSVFGRGIDYSKVWVHHGGWWLFMGLQNKNTAVTPNGEMYYPSGLYQYDFSSSSINGRWHALFMHEMVHVWQYQMGYGVKRHGLTVSSRGDSAYVYHLTEKSQLRDFNMEQQGNIMSDYYMICVVDDPLGAFNSGMRADLLRKVMEPFIENPRNKNHLPA
jgi:hypothetical protein